MQKKFVYVLNGSKVTAV